jgi:erythritol kinase (D-erythritol 1-phosphate-forming)
MDASYLLGIDAGTTLIKATLFNLDGRELAVAAHPSSLLNPRPGWAEADAEAVWQSVIASVRAVLSQQPDAAAHIAAIGLTGQGDGTWLVDADLRPVRPAILWSDGRTGPLVEESHRSGLSTAIFAITGTAFNTGNQAGHLRWLQEHEPESLRATAHVLRAKDWLFLCMTGVASTDETDASHTYFSVHHRLYDERILDLLGIRDWLPMLPPVRSAAANCAELSPGAAAALGLRTGTPVVAGPFDVAASALGVGVVFPGDACSVLGTAGVHQVVTDAPVMEPANIGYNMCHAPAGRLMRLLPTMTNTQNLQWFAREFCAAERTAVEEGKTNLWDALETAASRVSLGSHGVIYHPYIDAAGERAPFVSPHARAQFSGLSAQHGRDVMLRAVYEGVVLSALDCYTTMNVPISELRPAGGGSRSPLWSQMLADALGCPVVIVEGTEYGAKGAIINAGVAVEIYPSYEEGIARTVRVARRYTPDPARRPDYLLLLELYRAIRDAMIPVWAQRTALLQRLGQKMEDYRYGD